jgi:hypothetical protein
MNNEKKSIKLQNIQTFQYYYSFFLFILLKIELANTSIELSLESTVNSYDLLSLDDRKTSIDAPDFEYDEDYNNLVADKGKIIT